ncbi:MAG: PQQ-binding-like beta-propeller repeat protein [Candidatus Eisenbacteria bacterium]
MGTLVLAAGVLTALAVDSPAAGLQNSAWPMLQRNAEHEGRTMAPISSSPSIVWSQAVTDSTEYSSPAIDLSGNLYIGDVGDRLTKVSPQGTVIWNYDTGGNLRRSSPAIADDGTVYVGSSDGVLHAVNSDGTQRWTFTAGGPIKTSPTVGADGSIYFGADDGVLYSLDTAGAMRWSYATSDTIRSSPAILSDTLVVVGSNDGGVYALRTDGTFRWNGFTGGPVKAGITVGQGDDIFVASQDRFLYALRKHGALNWSIFTDNTLRTAPSIGIRGDIYLAQSNELFCYADDGDTSWVATLPAEILGTPIVHTNPPDSLETVIVGAEDGSLYGLVDGDIVWSVALGGAIRGAAAVGADGTIYVGANDGRIYALGDAPAGLADGTGAGWKLQVGPNPSVPGQSISFRSPDGTDGRLLFLDPAGRRVGEAQLRDGAGVWDGKGADGRDVAPGVYFYRLEAGGSTGSGRIIRVR